MIARIPVITLYQPWASLIMAGHKTIETRRHARFAGLKGKLIGIHAGKKMDLDALSMCAVQFPELYSALQRAPRGALLGTVWVQNHRRLGANDSRSACIDCSAGDLFGLILTNILPLREPVPMQGGRGIWYADFEIPYNINKSKEQ